jgi:hypothetical protein
MSDRYVYMSEEEFQKILPVIPENSIVKKYVDEKECRTRYATFIKENKITLITQHTNNICNYVYTLASALHKNSTNPTDICIQCEIQTCEICYKKEYYPYTKTTTWHTKGEPNHSRIKPSKGCEVNKWYHFCIPCFEVFYLALINELTFLHDEEQKKVSNGHQ